MALVGRPAPAHDAADRYGSEVSIMVLKIVVALVLLGHGIGHSMGLLQLSSVATVNPAWHGDSWILSGALGATPTHIVGAVLWTVALVGFAAVAGVVIGWLPIGWFAPLAIASSVASLVGVLLFPIAFPLVSTIGAIAVDVAVLVAVLWYQWTPADLAA
jgi:hypothetical protein